MRRSRICGHNFDESKLSTVKCMDLSRNHEARDLRGICAGFAQHLRGIGAESARDLRRICAESAGDLRGICVGSTQDLRGICTGSSRDLRGIYGGSARNLREICAEFTRTLPPTPNEMLDQPTVCLTNRSMFTAKLLLEMRTGRTLPQ